MINDKKDFSSELIKITKQLFIDSGEPYRREMNLDHSLQRHLGIDSLSRGELFSRIEKSFEVTLPDQLLAKADTLRDIEIYLETAVPEKFISSPRETINHGKTVVFSIKHAHTLVEVLELYASKTPDKPHIYFQNEQGQQEILTYGDLLQQASSVAQGLKAAGLYEGDKVAIMQPTQLDFFYAFFGVLLGGGTPVPIYPPFRLNQLEAYAKTEARILRNAEVRVLITFTEAEKLSVLLRSFVPSLKLVTTVSALKNQGELTQASFIRSNDAALIQYTSGSTADPKGVLLTHHNLLENIRGYGKGISVTPDDVAVSWLPLYHDMGLIGMWLGSLCHGVPLVLMTPFSFLNRPERWLWALHHHRGTLSGGPNFAYELCVRKIEPHQIEGLDLSSWRMAANGAEKIYPETLRNFVKKFEPYGFRRRAILPVYGLAESSVSLTIPTPDHDFIVDKIDRNAFEKQHLAQKSEAENAMEFVACGKPLEGHDIRIVDANQEILPERHIGHLQFRGPSTMQGYFNNPEATRAVFHEDWVDTGDLAYIVDNEVYLTGRYKDLIIKAGRNLYPVEIEALVAQVNGVRKGCVAAFSIEDKTHETEQLIVVAETKEKNKEKQTTIIDAIREIISIHLDIVPDHIVLVAPHIVPKTSSGKLQRAACKAMYIENKLVKKSAPGWLQYILLKLKSSAIQCFRGVKWLGKLFFTIYTIAMATITALPFFIYIKFVSVKRAAVAARNWGRLVLWLAGFRMKIINADKLMSQTPVVYAANHTSYLDAIVMLAALPAGTRIIAKKEVLNIPIVSSVIKKLNFMAVDRLDFSKGIEDTIRCEQILRDGISLMIFPEGTFGYGIGLRPFKLGAFKMAVETQVPVFPLALQGTRFILRDDNKLLSPGRITITVCDAITPMGNDWKAITQLRQKVREQIAKYCGEPTLDLIVAETIAPKQTR